MTDDNRSAFDEESTDFYDEFKDRMRQEPLKSVLTQTPQTSKPIGGIVTVLIGVFLGALVLWYIVGKYFISSNNEAELAPPVISADADPIKEKPEDAGGMKILGKDKSVYNRISSADEKEPERIIRRVEEPVPVPAPEKVKVLVKETPSPIVQEKGSTSIVSEKPSLPKALEKTSISQALSQDDKKEVEVKKTEVKPVYTPKKEEAKAPVVEKPATLAKGWKVQVLSSRDKEAVAKTWETLKAKHPDLLGNVSHEIAEADLGAKGMFYRLRIGGFTDRKQADDLCSKLKNRKLDCFVVNK